MKDKIKVLTVNTKKKPKKSKGSSMTLGQCIEPYAPGMYICSEVYVGDAIEVVETLRPEIIWILQEAPNDYSQLVKEIKKVHPAAAIFMMLFGAYDNEQEMMNIYSALGVYKCYFLPPLMLDVLAHDMYVALNME